MEPSPVTDNVEKGTTLHRSDTTYTIETRYIQMLLEDIPWFYSILADAAHWALLAGYLVVPGTFTSMQKSLTLNEDLKKTEAGQTILNTIQNPPLLAIACFLMVLGALLMFWLSWERRNNYIWLINKLFMPTLLSALAGLVTTLVNIYTAREGEWSIMALLTTIVTGLSASGSLTLLIIYRFGKLVKVKQEHEMETKAGFQRVSP
ncbi:hypothetical protein BDV26DRAFT_287303 [Aspergillus bertholletiae]|uniref:Transmembrane protein n=2 Tax=Aspergillus subgen. Circumdati TaxID=2720871 RepID=A0A2G7G5C7_9EURO|nr:hypothetical protein BDV24DRAFT_156591 [Aspergillus arachidicola]KAE8383891.1 hypothetical protein BDV26DRAFT_287303 [Aspergillus bertholletiae]PIG87795.1 hypothetical protein AARAC_011988 [Aspergillus arachidicola]